MTTLTLKATHPGIDMLALIASITALLASTTILMVGSGLLGTLLSVRMTVGGFGTGTTGLVMSAYFLGLMLGAIGAGVVIRRAGHIRAFAVFASVVTAMTLLHALYITPLVWGILRAVAGFSLAGLYMVIESWLNERGQGGARGRLFSLYQIASYLGLGAGQFILPLRPVTAPDLFIINAMVFALCLIPVSLTRAINPTPPERHRLQFAAVFSGSPLGAFICLAAGVVNGSAFALAPVFVIGHAGVQSVSVFMAALVLGGMLLQYPIGHLSDIFDRRWLMVGVNLALLAVIAVLQHTADKGLIPLAATGTLFGGLTFTLYPLAVAHINDRIRGGDFVGVAATLLFLWGLGAVLGPLAIGRLMDAIGSDGLLLAVAATVAVAALATIAARRESVPNAEQSAFVGMARTTSVITEMDPRYEEPVDPQLDWIKQMEAAEHGRGAEPARVSEPA